MQVVQQKQIGNAPLVKERVPLPVQYGKWMSPHKAEHPTYFVTKRIGTGAYATVFLARCTATLEWVAVKQVTKEPTLSEEIAILKHLTQIQHEQQRVSPTSPDFEDSEDSAAPCLIMFTELKEVHQSGDFNTGGQQYLVMSLCQGGTVQDAQRRAPALFAQEDMLKAFTRNLLEKVAWMHSCGVANMDLKPENLLFETQADWTPSGDTTKRDAALQQPVLSDFGLATFQPKSVSYRGTPGYVAPEMIRAEQIRQMQKFAQQKAGGTPVTVAGGAVDTYACDMFSVGSIIAELRCQRNIFAGNSPRAAIDNTLQVDVMMQAMVKKGAGYVPSGLATASPQLQEFLSKLLVSDPELRMTAAEALAHSWLSQE